jgi:DHA1 family tetracycline resistance protein-like MFS transporter
MSGGGQEEVWVPVTVHLPLGFAKAWNPNKCAPISLLCGPYVIILFAMLGNTLLVPVLPFLVKETGSGARDYGILQSAMWISQTVLSPLLGALSDKIGRRSVIFVSLLISTAGCALLGFSHSFVEMLAARVITGSGFQIALFRAYFADTQPKEKRTGSFGLIGVIQGASLFIGPTLGGLVSAYSSKRMAAFAAAASFALGGVVCLVWKPDEDTVEVQLRRRASSAGLTGDALKTHQDTRKTVGGVKFVKVSVDTGLEPGEEVTYYCGPVGKALYKFWLLMVYLAKHGVIPLLFLNFFFRFAFAAYKSNFAFLCYDALKFGPKEVGFVLSGMGLGGIFVQGVLVRFVVSRIAEERTLLVAMATTSVGFAGLSYVTSVYSLAPCLALVSIGYGLAVPCLSTLFSHVPIEQGIMQGIAGSIDRFGQSFGPILGGWLLDLVGQGWLMLCTGAALACISGITLLFVGDGCLSWIKDSIFGKSTEGYDPVEGSDNDTAIEMEMVRRRLRWHSAP